MLNALPREAISPRSGLLYVDDVLVSKVLLLVILHLDIVRAKEAKLVIVLYDLHFTGQHAFQPHLLTLSVPNLDQKAITARQIELHQLRQDSRLVFTGRKLHSFHPGLNLAVLAVELHHGCH
ncbi:MAG: hypothetical protein M0R50_02745 [Candidatus Cloacimonetes bacterium]|jgi:hypothetical protein|nr:hypothetical protein [Candidatus Cloacimonadota bacterium]